MKNPPSNLIPSGAQVSAAPPVAHAFASPSKLATIELCPYCARQCEGWDSPRSDAAKHGAAMHEAVYNDEVFETLSDGDKLIVRKVRAYCVDPYLDGYTIYYERKIEIKDGNTVLTYGTCDELIVSDDKKTILVNDHKFGSFPVPKAEENLQIWAYVVGAFQEFPDCERVYAEIIQPSEGLSSENMACFTREDYPKMLATVASIVRKAVEATPGDAVPSPEACKFCNKDTCSAYQNAMKAGLDAYCDSLTVETPDLPMPELVKWCDNKLQQVALAEAYLKEIGGRLKQVILANEGSDSYRLVTGRVQKTVDWKAICEECKVPAEVVEKHTTARFVDPYLVAKKRKNTTL